MSTLKIILDTKKKVIKNIFDVEKNKNLAIFIHYKKKII